MQDLVAARPVVVELGGLVSMGVFPLADYFHEILDREVLEAVREGFQNLLHGFEGIEGLMVGSLRVQSPD